MEVNSEHQAFCTIVSWNRCGTVGTLIFHVSLTSIMHFEHFSNDKSFLHQLICMTTPYNIIFV